MRAFAMWKTCSTGARSGGRRPDTPPCHRSNDFVRSVVGLLAERELDGLRPRHRPPFFEGSGRSRLAEPRAGCAEVTLAEALEYSRPGADLQLLPSRFDGAFEVNCILVSSETAGDHGETEDFDD